MAKQPNHTYCNANTSTDEPHYVEPNNFTVSTSAVPNIYVTLDDAPAASPRKGKEQWKLWKILAAVFILTLSMTSFCISIGILLKEDKELTRVHLQSGEEQENKGKPIRIPEVRRRLVSLTKENSEVKLELQRLKNELRTGYSVLDDGWVGLHNGYQYKLTKQALNYNDSKLRCGSMGGKLAVEGVQVIENRRILQKALDIDEVFWIGLNDIHEEGQWRWESGEVATNVTALWKFNEPNNRKDNEDCATISRLGSVLSNDVPCSLPYIALCERPVES